MAIYDFSKTEKDELKFIEEEGASARSETIGIKTKKPARFFSAFAARLFFLLLLIGDLIWIGYALIRFSLSLIGRMLTAGKVDYFKSLGEKAWVSLRRSLVCAVSLFIALFNPAFGIMIACTYFLMYDKSGIEEVVPSSLQSQFKEFLPREE
ncbi:MAG: hypothetical protein WA347_05950 [Rhabdochlamydiaceae bacterium]|jgi:hypothetical protein